MRTFSNIALCLLLFVGIACEKAFNTTGFIVAETGTLSNGLISSLERNDFNFKVKYKNESEYYIENKLDSVRVFVFSMSYRGQDPLEFLAADRNQFGEALERNAFNKERVFGAIASTGDTLYPLLTSAPRTYGVDGRFTTLLSFHHSIAQQPIIRLFYRDKAITATPILFQFNP